MFEKLKNLRHFLAPRLSGKLAVEAPVIVPYGQNNVHDMTTSEFRRQFLLPMSVMQGDIAVMESPFITMFWRMNVITIPVFVAASLINPLFAFGALVVTSLYGSFKVGPEVAIALEKASAEVTEKLRSGDTTNLPSVEKWLQKNRDKLPTYLDKRERHQEEHRRLVTLIKRINNNGNADNLKEADRSFLKSRGYKNFKTPIPLPYEYSPAYFLSSKDHTQLSRAFYYDLYRQAGPDASVIRRVFSFRANGPIRNP